MNIKRLVRSQEVRHFLLKLGSWIPDRIMLPIQYYLILHRFPNLKNPIRFSEWIQLYKMYYRNDAMEKCVDKYAVRQYVTSKLGGGNSQQTVSSM